MYNWHQKQTFSFFIAGLCCDRILTFAFGCPERALGNWQRDLSHILLSTIPLDFWNGSQKVITVYIQAGDRLNFGTNLLTRCICLGKACS